MVNKQISILTSILLFSTMLHPFGGTVSSNSNSNSEPYTIINNTGQPLHMRIRYGSPEGIGKGFVIPNQDLITDSIHKDLQLSPQQYRKNLTLTNNDQVFLLPDQTAFQIPKIESPLSIRAWRCAYNPTLDTDDKGNSVQSSNANRGQLFFGYTLNPGDHSVLFAQNGTNYTVTPNSPGTYRYLINSAQFSPYPYLQPIPPPIFMQTTPKSSK